MPSQCWFFFVDFLSTLISGIWVVHTMCGIQFIDFPPIKVSLVVLELKLTPQKYSALNPSYHGKHGTMVVSNHAGHKHPILRDCMCMSKVIPHTSCQELSKNNKQCCCLPSEFDINWNQVECLELKINNAWVTPLGIWWIWKLILDCPELSANSSADSLIFLAFSVDKYIWR